MPLALDCDFKRDLVNSFCSPRLVVTSVAGDIISNSYKLEYGSNTLCLQKNAIKHFNKFCIVDDLLATGGTASSVEKMLSENNKEITGLAVVVELLFLNGRQKLNSSVESIVSY